MNNIYYDINKTLSKQRLFSFVIGARGCGKTYAFKKRAITNFLKTGAQFIYIRRYETEFPAAEIRNFFDDIACEFPDHDFVAGKGLFKIDNMIAGWYIPLSKAKMLKSIPFPNVSFICFDEFIIETGMHHYLPNEVTSFFECYSTISRDRDVPVLFMSNAITMSNPYFVYFDIKFEKEQTTYLTEFISVEIIKNQSFEDHMKSTKFGRMLAGTTYGEYALSNKFLLDTDSFIEPMDGPCSYLATFVMDDKDIGFYVNNECNKWYLSFKIDKTCNYRYTINVTSHTEQTVLAAKNNIAISTMINKFCQGLLRFETQQVKNFCVPIIKKLI